MMSGHHDTWYFGVMDNGSANAGMMEAARLCAARRSDWKRGLRLCFWSGHSHGRYSGSAWYADEHWDELDRRCVAHVNVDSLGGTGASVLAHAAAMSELWPLAREAVEHHTSEPYAGHRKNRSSDESFVGIGIPSMFGIMSEQPARHAQARNALGWWWHTPEDLIDKVDEANLVRDTRILAEVTARLLTETILPMDHRETAAALARELDTLDAALGGRFPIASLTEATARLARAAASVAARRSARPPADPRRANAALMRASRALVPVDYAEGDRFAHPRALPLPTWAVLEPLRHLAATPAGSDAEQIARVGARRARNRMLAAVQAATAALDEACAALG
jgi:hypothetical protein